MILVDTSVRIDHLRRDDNHLRSQLDAGAILCHPFVIKEIALGNLRQRDKVLATLRGLPAAAIVTDAIVLAVSADNALAGKDVGFVDIHFLASTQNTPYTVLLTRDRRLEKAARSIDLFYAG